jgi:hypothetical protein
VNRVLGQRYRVHLRPHMGRIQALCDETCFVPRPPAAARRPGPQLLTAGEAGTVRAFRSAALAESIARLRRRQSAAARRWPVAAIRRREAGMQCQHELAVARYCDRLFFASHAQDVRPFLARAALAVAPLRIASGAPRQALKVLALQKALVASRPALEGVRARPDSEVLLALALPAASALAKAATARSARGHNGASSLAPLAARLEGVACPAAGAL